MLKQIGEAIMIHLSLGEWRRGLRSGKATFTNSAGERREGIWKATKRGTRFPPRQDKEDVATRGAESITDAELAGNIQIGGNK